MKTPGLEQILFLVVFIVLPLLNVLFQRVKRHFETKPPEDESWPDIAPEAQEIPQLLRKPRMSRDRLHEIQAPTVSTSLPGRNRAKKLTLGSRQEIRRGIILKTVLGPCRAFDPPS
ncbi:MAG: hypothetical protein ACYDHC_07595 [Desulfuromonadaceae bacterium]